MTPNNAFNTWLLASACGLALSGSAHAIDVSGAWASSAAACEKIFVKRDNKIAFARGAHRYGRGFIVDGDRIRGRVGTCRIASRQDSPTAQFVAKCTANVFDAAQFTLKIIDNDRMARVRPGRPEAEEVYERCFR
jgi:hypothetical protein